MNKEKHGLLFAACTVYSISFGAKDIFPKSRAFLDIPGVCVALQL